MKTFEEYTRKEELRFYRESNIFRRVGEYRVFTHITDSKNYQYIGILENNNFYPHIYDFEGGTQDPGWYRPSGLYDPPRKVIPLSLMEKYLVIKELKLSKDSRNRSYLNLLKKWNNCNIDTSDIEHLSSAEDMDLL